MVKVYDNFANDFLYQTSITLWFAENHDTHRINHVYQNDFRKYQMTMAITVADSQLYYGSEIGMSAR
jgi:glycosidase